MLQYILAHVYLYIVEILYLEWLSSDGCKSYFVSLKCSNNVHAQEQIEFLFMWAIALAIENKGTFGERKKISGIF